MVGRPVRLTSVRWWRSPDVAASISLTTAQREAIDRIYEQRSAGRRRCVERLVEASNKVDEFIRDGVYDENILKGTEAVAGAATEERIVTRNLSDEIVALLSPPQREKLRTMLHGRIVE
jgi:Spy/CpxP family protein refolding chaperone